MELEYWARGWFKVNPHKLLLYLSGRLMETGPFGENDRAVCEDLIAQLRALDTTVDPNIIAKQLSQVFTHASSESVFWNHLCTELKKDSKVLESLNEQEPVQRAKWVSLIQQDLKALQTLLQQKLEEAPLFVQVS